MRGGKGPGCGDVWSVVPAAQGQEGGHKRDIDWFSGALFCPFLSLGLLVQSGHPCLQGGLCGQVGIEHKGWKQVSFERAAGAVSLAALPPSLRSASEVLWVAVTAFPASRPALGHLALTCTPLPGPHLAPGIQVPAAPHESLLPSHPSGQSSCLAQACPI